MFHRAGLAATAITEEDLSTGDRKGYENEIISTEESTINTLGGEGDLFTIDSGEVGNP